MSSRGRSARLHSADRRMFEAVVARDPEAVADALHAGADVIARFEPPSASSSSSSSSYAAASRATSVISKGWTPLLVAVGNVADIGVVRALLTERVSAQLQRVTDTGDTALHLAASSGQADIVTAILEAAGSGAKAIVSMRNGFGTTPLHHAARCVSAGGERALWALACHGADLYAAETYGQRPLDTATEHHNRNGAYLLLRLQTEGVPHAPVVAPVKVAPRVRRLGQSAGNKVLDISITWELPDDEERRLAGVEDDPEEDEVLITALALDSATDGSAAETSDADGGGGGGKGGAVASRRRPRTRAVLRGGPNIAISGFVVRASPGDFQHVIDDPRARSAALDKSLLDGEFTFTVCAMNKFGVGPASAKSERVVTTGPPMQPSEVSLVPGKGSIIVSWRAPPADPGRGVPTSYIVRVFKAGDSAGALAATHSWGGATTTSAPHPSRPRSDSESGAGHGGDGGGDDGDSDRTDTETSPRADDEADGDAAVHPELPGSPTKVGDIVAQREVRGHESQYDAVAAEDVAVDTMAGGATSDGLLKATIWDVRDGRLYSATVQSVNSAGVSAERASAPSNLTVPSAISALLVRAGLARYHRLVLSRIGAYTIADMRRLPAKAVRDRLLKMDLPKDGVDRFIASVFREEVPASPGSPAISIRTGVPPLEPREVRAVPGDMSCTVLWKAPAEDSIHDKPTHYHVTARAAVAGLGLPAANGGGAAVASGAAAGAGASESSRSSSNGGGGGSMLLEETVPATATARVPQRKVVSVPNGMPCTFTVCAVSDSGTSDDVANAGGAIVPSPLGALLARHDMMHHLDAVHTRIGPRVTLDELARYGLDALTVKLEDVGMNLREAATLASSVMRHADDDAAMAPVVPMRGDVHSDSEAEDDTTAADAGVGVDGYGGGGGGGGDGYHGGPSIVGAAAPPLFTPSTGAHATREDETALTARSLRTGDNTPALSSMSGAGARVALTSFVRDAVGIDGDRLTRVMGVLKENAVFSVRDLAALEDDDLAELRGDLEGDGGLKRLAAKKLVRAATILRSGT